MALGGAVFAPIAYFLLASAPLAAVALSSIMVGLTCVALSIARPEISPEAAELMLRTGMENTASLLEELGLNSKAIYLPSTMRDGHPQALVPMVALSHAPGIKDKIPGRLIVRYGNAPEDMAIAVTTPGSITVSMLDARPGPSPTEIEAAITQVLVGILEIARSVTVNATDTEIVIDVSGSKLRTDNTRYDGCLGSPIASIVASIACEALLKPVRIANERIDRGQVRISLEVLA